jgi:phosphodiester glycosidase
MPRGFADQRLCRLFAIGLALAPALLGALSASADQTLHALTSNGSALRVQLKLRGETVISYVEIDPARHRLDIAQSPDTRGGSTLRQFLAQEGAAIAFTGGYLRSFVPPEPTGYLMVDGVELSSIVRDDRVVDAVVCLGRAPSQLTALSVAAASRFRRTDAHEDCVQAGPLLIRDGERSYDLGRTDRLGRLSGEFERAFLALRRNGELILGVSSSASLSSLQEALLAPEEEGGLAAQIGVVLTGATTAGMEVAGGLGYSFGTTSTPLPNALVVDAGRLERP